MDESLENKREQEWRTFELYEKVRVRDRRKKIFLSTLAALGFLTLCAVPIVEERLPKWKSLKAAQELSFEIEKLKLIAIKHKKAAKISFLETGEFRVELLANCEGDIGGVSPKSEILEQTKWDPGANELKVLNPLDSVQFNVKLAIDQLCFDPVKGTEGIKNKKVVVIVPVKDLAENRLDRASYIILETPSVKISIN